MTNPKNLIKDRFTDIFSYLSAIVIVLVLAYVLQSSITVQDDMQTLKEVFENYKNASDSAASSALFEQIQSIVNEKNKKLIWSVSILGFFGFVLVFMNIEKLCRLKGANRQQEDSLGLLEKQLEGIQKAEKDKEALQEQLYQAQKLEAVGRLAGGIAHDFNNILAAMNGYAEFLIDDLDKESQQHSFAKNILKAGKQARELVDKMLAFSRRDHDKPQKMQLSNSIDETLSMLKASLPKTVDVQSDITDENFLIEGNPTLVSQALMNLCVNSKDAMPNEKGRLAISLSTADMSYFEDMDSCDDLPKDDDLPLINIIDVSAKHTCLTLGSLSKKHKYMCLSVADDGTGMPRVIMENIFEPFFTTKPVDKGTGLGLAMVHGVVIAHKGAMQINSIAGKGTRFDLLFPIVDEKQEDETENDVDKTFKGVGTVLVVDDQEDVRIVTETMLKRMGFEVESCNGAEAAIEIIREHSDYFDIVVTDHNMPQKTGLDLIKTIADEIPELPFVLLTGYSTEEMANTLDEYPSLTTILKKPVEKEKLLEAVQSAILSKQFAA